MSFVRARIPVFWFLALIIAFASPSAAQDSDAEMQTALDTFMQDKMRELNIPGAAIGVIRNDQIIYLQGYGIAAPDGRTVTPQTPFLLASLSKSFTGLAIMQLVEAGRLTLDDPVQQHIGWFRPNDSPPMTVKHLLYHTSGFSTYDGTANFANTDATDGALERNIRRLHEVTLKHPVGQVHEYSNANYDVLGYLVQVVSGQSYETYIEQNILTPLEMTHSFLSPDAAAVAGMASAYYPFFGNPTAYAIPFSRGSVPSAEIISSAEDMAKYLIAHLNSGQYGETSILSPEGTEQLHRIGFQHNLWSGYAMGWNVYPLYNAYTPQDNPVSFSFPTALEHEGTFVGFRSQMLLVPQEGLGVVALMNTSHSAYESAYRSVAEGVTHLMLGYPAPPTAIYEDWLQRNALAVGIGLLVLQFGRMLSSIRNLRRWQRGEVPRSPLRRAGAIIIPAALDLVMAYAVLFALPESVDTPFPVLIQFVPDIGLLALAVLIITLGWGALRTLLSLILLRSRRVAVVAVPSPQPAT